MSIIIKRLRDYYHPDAVANADREESNKRWESFNKFTLAMLALWMQGVKGQKDLRSPILC